MTTRSMAVTMLSHVASPAAPTGAERSLALLASGLAERGHRVRVITPGPWSLGDALTRTGVAVETVATRPCWLTYYERRPWPLAAANWLRWAVASGAGRRLEQRLRELDPDVVHVNCLPHLSGAAAARAAGIPVVWHLREILPPGARRRWFARRLEHDASRVVAVSQAVADWVRAERVALPLDVVHNGVEPPRSPPPAADARRRFGLGAADVVVGLFGQLLPHKAALDFVRAATAVAGRTPGASFLIAGDGSRAYLARIDRAIAAGGHRGRIVRLAGRADPTELFAAADIVALTTRTPDPFPRSVLEAMAWGRPVVAYRSGGVPEMVEHDRTGLLVAPGDVAGLAAALSALIDDEARRTAMGRRAIERVRERFTLVRHVERIERLLELARRPAASSANGVL
ncbi:MAG TPA: glycosyltransferase family 4 protein [Candidatus Polarisedimenticolaceae bacterium]|nr:glycosyltransferase family 4 protein [Candidatus Polarisedimenticolaceae bacterium]